MDRCYESEQVLFVSFSLLGAHLVTNSRKLQKNKQRQTKGRPTRVPKRSINVVS